MAEEPTVTKTPDVQNELEQTQDDVQQLTAKELQALKDSTYDKARNDLMEKFKQDQTKIVEEAKKQALAESKMTADEKAQAEWEAKNKELAERAEAIKQRELSADITKQLATAGLPVELSDKLLSLGDAKATDEFISTIKEVIQKQANEEITKRTNGGKPKSSASNLGDTDDPFAAAAKKLGF